MEHDLTFSQAKTQPIRTVQTGRSRIRRIALFLLIVVSPLAVFVSGFAFGRGMRIQPAARAIVATAIAGLPTSIPSPKVPAPIRLTPNLSPIPPTATAIPSASPVPPTSTPMPTATKAPPTSTPIPTATNLPPSSTPVPKVDIRACYVEKQAWVTGEMNIRENPTVHSIKAGTALAGESFDVLESRQGETYCWLRISRGWMAKTAYVSAANPQQREASAAGSGVRQALITLSALVVAPENRCSPYDSDSYPYSQSVEAQIVSKMGGRVYGPYTGKTFSSTRETDIEHIVAKSEAHDSGLCGAGTGTRRTFSNDLLNLTLASPSVNRHQKSGKDFAEWTPALNRCWFADTTIKVKFKYGLTVDSREKAALESTLLGCASVSMVFAGAAGQQAQPVQQQPRPQQHAQPATTNWQQWDTNGNGRITCAEAREAGIAPVRRGHPAYPRMDDRDNDGVVCE